MQSNRINTLISFIESNDKVCDIGCDHGYLAINLLKNSLCQKIIATDINQNALNICRQNIKKGNYNIKTYLSDGLLNVPDKDIDTLVIAGMGTFSILHIIDTIKTFKIKKIITQANNDLPLLRKEMNKKGFYLTDEKIVFEHNHYYTICLFTKNKVRLNILKKYYGIYKLEHKNYYQFLYNQLIEIHQKLPRKSFKRFKNKFKIILLRKYL